MSRFISLLLASSLLFTQTALADESIDAIKGKISSVVPVNQIKSISESPVEGLMEVRLLNGQLFYASDNGNYVIDGTLFQLTDQGVVNLEQERINKLMVPRRLDAINNFDEADLVTFKPKGETKATIYAFTDVDCGYCRKLHREMQSYNDIGIEIKYLAYPRAGIGSSSYDKMVAIWCADDPQQAMTKAKAGKAIEMAKCENPVAEQFALGGKLGVTGTPSLLTTDGQLLPGYMPAERLSKALGIN